MKLAAAALLLISVCLASAAAGTEDDVARDRAALLDGIDALDLPGAPGNLVVFGADAFAVVTGGDAPEPVIAAARFGDGRVVAMAHSGYLDAAALSADDDSRGRLLRNAIAWVAKDAEKPRIGILGRDPALVGALRGLGCDAWDGADPAEERTADVYVWKNGHDREGLAAAVVRFVGAGGGLISAACPWGWAQIRNRTEPDLTVRDDLPENAALRRMGLVYGDGTVAATQDGRYALDRSRPDDAHAGLALAALVAGEKDAARRTHAIEQALRALPLDDDGFRPVVERAIAGVPAQLVPRPGAPLGRAQALARLAVTVRSLTWRELAPEDVPAAPGSDAFPGAVPAGAERVTATLRPDPAVKGWQGTGLYLPPGEVLTVRGAGGAEPRGWRLRIGCHTDTLWQKDRWERWPEISRAEDLGAEPVRVASPWGGSVYVEALLDTHDPVEIELSGAVRAPRYVLDDEASAKAWAASRAAPGPWAELEGRNIVLSVPSAVIRALDDPAPILAFWDAALASHCELAQTPLPERRERFVPDAQISAGYMHSGYPIMTWMDVVTPKDGHALPPILDIADRKANGAWGYFHELGHNRQRAWWTFRGTTEVTCNLFSLYTSEKLLGIEPWENPWLQNQKKRAKAYLAKGAPFEEWRRDPGLALLAYAQIQHAFGWEPFQRVFAEMEALPPDRRPTADQDKIDAFIGGMSRATGHDLRPFWRRWGGPLGEELGSAVAPPDLPEWQPDWSDLP